MSLFKKKFCLFFRSEKEEVNLPQVLKSTKYIKIEDTEHITDGDSLTNPLVSYQGSLVMYKSATMV